MTTTTRLLIAAALVTSSTLISLAQLNIAPPTTEPATQPETRPATQPATVPSAQSVLENLLNSKSTVATSRPAPAASTTNPALTPATEAVAPNEPKAIRRREGEFLQGKTGRLVRDEKTGVYIFTFDSDGKHMYDPPLKLLPCSRLEQMEESSEKGSLNIKFKISGDITEFHGQNYLHVRDVLIVKDLNQGIGG